MKEKYKEYYDFAVKFHGHSCPGMLSGLLMSIYVLENFNVDRSIDEELVAISEGTSCMVDGIQAVLGTTLGKGNLFIKDHGKNAAVFLNRAKGEGIRLTFNFLKMREIIGIENFREQMGKMSWKERSKYLKNLFFKLLDQPFNELFSVENVKMKFPDEAQIHETIICESCGEGAMSTRIREINGKKLCISCAEGKYWQ